MSQSKEHEHSTDSKNFVVTFVYLVYIVINSSEHFVTNGYIEAQLQYIILMQACDSKLLSQIFCS